MVNCVRLAVIQRLPWITKQREQFRSAERQSERELITGESHYVWGLRHRLKVVERPGRARRQILDRWQREQLRELIPGLIARWETIIGREVPRWSIRRMKTKWGSCDRETGHIWFNIELAKKHPDSLGYIVIHEMTHLLERNHGERFTRLMDQYLPNWRARRDQLNSAPLAHEKWDRAEGDSS